MYGNIVFNIIMVNGVKTLLNIEFQNVSYFQVFEMQHSYYKRSCH